MRTPASLQMCRLPSLAAREQDRIFGMDLVHLDDFDAEVSRRSASWRESGASWEFTRGPETDKPAAWVRIDSPQAGGELIIWVSGEAEMVWARKPFPDGEWGQEHYDLAGTAELQGCLDALERNIGLRT